MAMVPSGDILDVGKRIILSGKIKLVLRTGNGPTQLRFGASSPADPAPARTGVATFDPSGSVRRVSFDSAGKWGGGLADTAAGVSPFGGAPAFTRFAAAPTMPDNATTVLVPSGTALDLGAKLVLRGKVRIVLNTGGGTTRLTFGGTSAGGDGRADVATYDKWREQSLDHYPNWDSEQTTTENNAGPYGPGDTRPGETIFSHNRADISVPSGSSPDVGARLVFRGRTRLVFRTGTGTIRMIFGGSDGRSGTRTGTATFAQADPGNVSAFDLGCDRNYARVTDTDPAVPDPDGTIAAATASCATRGLSAVLFPAGSAYFGRVPGGYDLDSQVRTAALSVDPASCGGACQNLIGLPAGVLGDVVAVADGRSEAAVRCFGRAAESCVTGSPTALPTTLSPTHVALTTPAPTSAPTTSVPTTAAPTTVTPTTPQPTFARCGTGHGCDTDSTYCADRPDVTAGYTCECLQGFTRADGTSCVVTANPTAAPTTLAPTSAPTTSAPTPSPTALPASSTPSPLPTVVAPTLPPPTTSPTAPGADIGGSSGKGDGDSDGDTAVTATAVVLVAVAVVAAILLAVYLYKRAECRHKQPAPMASFENPVFNLDEADVAHAYEAPAHRSMPSIHDISATTEV